MTLFLFSANYPFGNGESFLANEIHFLSQSFETIIIIPTSYPKGNKNKSPLPANVRSLPPYLSKNIALRILRSYLNLAPGIEFLFDFFKKTTFSSRQKLNVWGNNFICCRTFLSSKHYKLLRRMIGEQDILYFYWGTGSASFIPYLVIQNRIVVKLHSSDAYLSINHNYLPLRRKIYSRADCILTISEGLKKYIVANYDIKDIGVKTIVSRLGTKDIGLNPVKLSEELVIVSCSYLIALKRVERIAQSLELINNTNIVWHHFGDGDLLESIRTMCLYLPPNIKAVIHGHVKNNEILNFYTTYHVDLFINVSSSEGIPVSIMEAMSTGIVTVATNVGATSELVDENCGYLLDADFKNEKLALIISEVRCNNFNIKRELTRAKWESFYNAEANYKKLSQTILG